MCYLSVWENGCMSGVTISCIMKKYSGTYVTMWLVGSWQDTDITLKQSNGESLIKQLFSKVWVGLREIIKG